MNAADLAAFKEGSADIGIYYKAHATDSNEIGFARFTYSGMITNGGTNGAQTVAITRPEPGGSGFWVRGIRLSQNEWSTTRCIWFGNGDVARKTCMVYKIVLIH